MPIYEYQCTQCNHQFDVMQKISDEPIKQCPNCDKNSVIKLVSAAGFQLKGTGWYATDFKNKTNAATKTDDVKTSSASSEAKNTTKGDN